MSDNTESDYNRLIAKIEAAISDVDAGLQLTAECLIIVAIKIVNQLAQTRGESDTKPVNHLLAAAKWAKQWNSEPQN